jgi:chitodextrinase
MPIQRTTEERQKAIEASMKIVRHLRLLTIVVAGCTAAACTISETKAPPVQGPSTLGLALVVAANPDVISLDGVSQSQITIDARDPNGQPVSNTVLRVETVVNGILVDYGTLSARTLVTGSNGRAALTYTAPRPVPGATNASIVNIRVTPTGTDAANQVGRYVDIRLVPPGTISVPGPTPSFVYSPLTPVAFEDVTFTSTSTSSIGTAIANLFWNFGDGTTASGTIVTHRFAEGTFNVILEVTDSSGISAQKLQPISVGAGRVPTATFVVSPPTGITVNSQVFFNASASTPGLGRRIVRYAWEFGNGSTGSGPTTNTTYSTVGAKTVTLTVTDDVGQTGVSSTVITVVP